MVQNLNVFYSYISCAGYNVILWLLIKLQEEGQIILIKCTLLYTEQENTFQTWVEQGQAHIMFIKL